MLSNVYKCVPFLLNNQDCFISLSPSKYLVLCHGPMTCPIESVENIQSMFTEVSFTKNSLINEGVTKLCCFKTMLSKQRTHADCICTSHDVKLKSVKRISTFTVGRDANIFHPN